MASTQEHITDSKKSPGSFQISEIYSITERGAFLVGHFLSGQINTGMRLVRNGRSLTISGIEFLDNIKEKKYWNALLFKEKPTKTELESLFTKGEILTDFVN